MSGFAHLFAGAMQGVMILFLSCLLLASGDLCRRKLLPHLFESPG